MHPQADNVTFALRFASADAAARLAELATGSQQKGATAAQDQAEQGLIDRQTDAAAQSDFARKTDAASAEIYFKYYGAQLHAACPYTQRCDDAVNLDQ